MPQSEKLPCHREWNEDFCVHMVKFLRSFICSGSERMICISLKDYSRSMERFP